MVDDWNTKFEARNKPTVIVQGGAPSVVVVSPQQGYAAPPPQGYPPQGYPPQGYAPPPQGYAPPPQGYAPPPQGGYPPQAYDPNYPPPGYVPPQPYAPPPGPN
ncbi:TM2 domain containing protein [Cavenderia fasciculata]|uniref:TM2 domain containing protein n=1 Tax=Cavenderia fasciculata TaxID=261658 RepID=F4PLQ1_CACFS|nr:TM2 domain containing protein [Cavenderia fasciculata]EGG23473.1 TM2 domain containing protein [Cavenderia fasciculata]|eukprot:XP_004361324.1 TM2 domain containing protein [Cavenderia fasciculata]